MSEWPHGSGEMANHIRTHDWTLTPLGPVSAWSERLKLMVEQVLASPLVASLVCGPEHVLIYNDTAAKLYGDRHPAALGRPLPEAFPEGWATVAAFYERAFLGETVQVDAQPLDTCGEGVAKDAFDALLAPVHETDGRVAYVHMTGFEVGDRVRTEAARRESETRHRLLIDSRTQAVWETDAAGAVVADSPSWRAYTGQSLEQWLGYGWLDAVHPDDRAYAERQWREAIAVRGLVDAEFRLRTPNGDWRWTNVRAAPALDAGGQIEKWVGMNIDIDARKRAEAALRESEELRRIALESGEMGAWRWDTRTGLVLADDAFQNLWDVSFSNKPHPASVYTDLMSPEGAAVLDAVAAQATVPGQQFHDQVQVISGSAEGRWVQWRGRAEHDRPWIINGVSFDITAQKLAEQRLRESEERFSQFAASSADGLWIRDARTMAMEYVSPAVEAIYGVAPDAILGDPKRWAALILPEDRKAALAHMEQTCAGEVVVHEFRIQRPSDGAFRWIRNTGFPLHDAQGQVQRIGGIAQDVTELKLSVEHTAVLLAELQHRVRNIMAMIRSITARTGERAVSVPEYAALMAGRLLTLSRVQALLTRAANAGVGILGIVRDELKAQAHHEGQFTVEGPDLILSPKAAEVLTLAVHELTTNALKYGGLSISDGHVTVRWATFEKRGTPWLGLDWTETGAPERPPPDPSVPRRRGFGSELIEGRIPYELGGRGKVSIEKGGARCHLEFPLREGASILETDAPQRAIVFGGVLDMTDEADLGGHRVLVVEDDFYLATDAARALRGAGAEVLGPCPNEEAAREELAEQRPDAAVIDINLGSGPSFKLAETLKDQGIPFVFTTGYDLAVIPTEFDGVERLQKPVQLRQIVAAIAKLVNKAA